MGDQRIGKVMDDEITRRSTMRGSKLERRHLNAGGRWRAREGMPLACSLSSHVGARDTNDGHALRVLCGPRFSSDDDVGHPKTPRPLKAQACNLGGTVRGPSTGAPRPMTAAGKQFSQSIAVHLCTSLLLQAHARTITFH